METQPQGKPKIKQSTIIISALIVLFIILHSTPNIALRTYLFMHGHPIIAFTSDIKTYTSYEENVHVLSVVPAPVETATGSKLKNYGVEKIFFLYFASYYGYC